MNYWEIHLKLPGLRHFERRAGPRPEETKLGESERRTGGAAASFGGGRGRAALPGPPGEADPERRTARRARKSERPVAPACSGFPEAWPKRAGAQLGVFQRRSPALQAAGQRAASATGSGSFPIALGQDQRSERVAERHGRWVSAIQAWCSSARRSSGIKSRPTRTTCLWRR